MIDQSELLHESGHCDSWICEHQDHTNRVKFVLPGLPMSVNSLYQVIWSQRRVELKPACRDYKTKVKVYIPRFQVSESSLINIDTIFSFPFHHKNGKLRKFDTSNMLKLLLDVISEKIGVDDSRIKAGSWQSRDAENESVTVTLTEIASGTR